MIQSDYTLYRGKCKEYSELLIVDNPALTLVRGHYDCPFWGLQPHWWCVDTNGEILDPTVKQFPSNGIGEYIPFNGLVTCSQCEKQLKEEDADFESNYVFCSIKCHMRFVGL